MLHDIMFIYFRSAIHLGPISFTTHELYTSFMSSLMVLPPVLLISVLFAKSNVKLLEDGNTNTNNSNRHGQKNHTKRKGKLPYWCIYIAYLLVVLSVVASGFFTILYAMEWGHDTANAWLTAFVLSFFQSVLLLQPAKVCFLYVSD